MVKSCSHANHANTFNTNLSHQNVDFRTLICSKFSKHAYNILMVKGPYEVLSTNLIDKVKLQIRYDFQNKVCIQFPIVIIIKKCFPPLSIQHQLA